MTDMGDILPWGNSGVNAIPGDGLPGNHLSRSSRRSRSATATEMTVFDSMMSGSPRRGPFIRLAPRLESGRGEKTSDGDRVV